VGRRHRANIHFVPHHLAHAASAFYSSGYSESGVLTIDGFGERSSSIFAVGTASGIQQMEETMLPGSLGVLYMMMTAYLGFKPLDGEYKVMGLASYGNPKTYAKQFEDLLDQAPDGTCRTTALLRDDFGDHIKSLFGPARGFGDAVTQREMDIAAALQAGLEEAMFCRLTHLKEKYGFERILPVRECSNKPTSFPRRAMMGRALAPRNMFSIRCWDIRRRARRCHQ
jgi:carbamoyltransferase